MTADRWTDLELKKLEARIAKEYKEASKELNQKAKEYFDRYADRWEEEHKAYEAGKYTDEQFKAWELAQLGRGSHWEDLRNQMTERLAQSAVIAQDYINNKLPAIYVKNSNEVATLATKSAIDQGVTGIRFDLVDEYAVRRLMMGSREVRPYKPIEIDLPRTNRFNYTKLQNALLQGILQGDSIDKLADRFQAVSNMNRSSAIRNARTACTGAQNGGKIDRYADIASKGGEVYKMWKATADERTRPEHMEAWQEYGSKENAIPYDEPFDVGGEELMYPADRNGSGWNIYNCRCTMSSFTKFHSILSEEMQKKANIRLAKDVNQTINLADTYLLEPAPKKYMFAPSRNIKEAEKAMMQFVDLSKKESQGLSYDGMSLQVANEVNRVLLEFFNKYNVKKLYGIDTPHQDSEYGLLVKQAFAGYDRNTNNLIFNRSYFKSMKSIENQILRDIQHVKGYIANPQRYDVNKIPERVLNVLKNSKESGRGNTIETIDDIIHHEMGHFIEKQIVVDKNLIKERMHLFASKISGYATDGYSEYIAESFSSYEKGENTIDPLLADAFKRLRR